MSKDSLAKYEEAFQGDVHSIMQRRDSEGGATTPPHLRMTFGEVLHNAYAHMLYRFDGFFSLSNYFHANKASSSQKPPHGFGLEDRTEGVMKHIESEIEEVRKARPGSPERLEELCDIVILACDAVWRGGYSFKQFTEKLLAKQAKNFGRTWPAMPADQASMHDRAPEEEPKAALPGLADICGITKKQQELVELHHNFTTHFQAWRGLLVDAVKYHQIKDRDRHDPEEGAANISYAQHELKAFLDAYTSEGHPIFAKPSEQK